MAPDTPADRPEPSAYAALEARVGRLEEDMREVRAMLGQMLPILVRIDATLPHLATKAELAELRTEVTAKLAEMPSKTYLWAVLAVLVTAYGAGLAAISVLR
jgi:hypothetical protein